MIDDNKKYVISGKEINFIIMSLRKLSNYNVEFTFDLKDMYKIIKNEHNKAINVIVNMLDRVVGRNNE